MGSLLADTLKNPRHQQNLGVIDLKRNIPFEESIMNCGATFLNPDTTPLLCYRAAKKFVDEYERKEREERHVAQERKWSSKKQRAYGKLLDCAIGRTSCKEICDAAIELAQACKPEREKPKVGEVYRDIFGNSYIVIGINDEEPFKKSFVTLIYFNARAELRSSEVFTVPLEDFMNPTFKKI